MCKLYQDKYTKHSNLSLSAYFLKYATLASYLDPKLTEVEIIEALGFHYPFEVQRAILNIQTKTISETLEVLKRIKLIEAQAQYSRSLNRNVNSIREDRRNERTRNMEDRNQEFRPVSKIYRRPNLERNNDYRSRRKVNYELEGEVNSRNTRTGYKETQEIVTKGVNLYLQGKTIREIIWKVRPNISQTKGYKFPRSNR
jgi:hypothetical protein